MEWGAKRRRTGGNDGTAGGASSTDASTEGQEAATSSGHDYEVFLSFRGPYTRAAFTDFLYTNLKGAGVRTFKDDEDLRKGVEFAQELLQAIKQSKILIPIFSKGYPSSVWCLKEVVQMVECKKNGRQKIMPIFYDVEPSEVRHQIGNYEEAFLLHESNERYDQKTIREWKDALRAVGAINGWELPREPTSRREGKFVKKFTQKIFNELKKTSLAISNYLVGVDHHVDEIMEMIGAGTSETRIIGITGMGGIGKTTIAKIIYDKLYEKFDNHCFLSNIREMSVYKGIECLQNQLISDILKEKWTNIRNSHEGTETIRGMLCEKKVLILLDDVDEKKHIDALVGSRDWFGKGSKLIITTRNKRVLVHKVDKIYEVTNMDTDQSLQLFSKHAFREDHPSDDDMNQSMRAIKIAGGLPLAIEVMGSFLSTIEKKKWDCHLAKLESAPHEDVRSKLEISYKVLDYEVKHIFLDIACLLIGYDKDILAHFWESKFHPECAFDVLESMCLIKIKEDNKVWMHDQLRDFGRQIVSQQMNIKEITRVWNAKDALELLKRQEKKKKLEALRLHLDHQHHFTYEDFKRLPNLRFLEVCGSNETFRAEERLLWHESLSNVLPIDNLRKNSDLLPQLRWLSWLKIPPTFNITNFSMTDVVILDLSDSKITNDWKGWNHMKVMKNLKVMNLSNCNCLERTPDFSAHSKLERMILWGCRELVETDKSICQLKSLVFLDVTLCLNLRKLPDKMGDLASLKYLYMSGCRSLEGLPNTIGNLKSLNELVIIAGRIKELPNALWTIEKLQVLEVDMGVYLHMEIGNGISENRSMRILKLHCNRIHVIPRLPESLTILELSTLYTHTSLDLSNLTDLKEVRLRFGPRDSDGESVGPVLKDPMPLGIGILSKLESLYLESLYATTIPINMRSLLPQLKSLELRCPILRCLPSLPSSLSSLSLISGCVTALPMDMSSLLPRLQSLHLVCHSLGCLPSLPSNLLRLILFGCKSCCSMEDLSNLKTLSDLHINGCAISKIRGLDRLENLGKLWLSELRRVEILPDLSNLNKLRDLKVRFCGNLVEIQGDFPPSLESFEIQGCKSLQKLPDLSSLKGLQEVEILFCGKLNVEAISSLCSKKRVKFNGDNIKSGCEFNYESEGEDDESGCESNYQSGGEDDESGCESDYESEGEGDESGCESDYESEGED